MKRSEYNILLATTVFLTIESKEFHPAIMTSPTEDELAAGVVPTQIYPPFWLIHFEFEGAAGKFKGYQNFESTEEATDDDLKTVIRTAFNMNFPWEFKPTEMEEDIPPPPEPESDDGEEPIDV